MLCVIDYGIGNVGSIINMVSHVGGSACLIDDPENLEGCSGFILPGVGRFSEAMHLLDRDGWIKPLTRLALEEKVPVLGICLGMQLMTKSSEESPGVNGLGWFNASTHRIHLPSESDLKVPHMGWNSIIPTPGSFFDMEISPQRLYFVHSYKVVCESECDVAAVTNFGVPFTSAIESDNLVGIQAHPEKSHRHGMRIIRKFLHQCGQLC